MVEESPSGASPLRRLSSTYVAVIAVGMVVGAGIFKSPALVADNAENSIWFFAVWIIGGIVSLLGALCYAELSTAFPDPGGDYAFLKAAYGRRLAFLFAWARFAVINTGSIALLGFVLGDYLNVVLSLGSRGPAIYAVGAILLLTAFNLRGVHGSSTANFTLTGIEALGLLLLVGAAVWLVWSGVPPADPGAGFGPAPPSIGLALVFVLLAYGGWSEISTLSAEVRDRKRGMVRALTFAVGFIGALYLAANWALWRGLGLDGLAASNAPAADLMDRAFGPRAAGVLALGVAFATITSINATMVVGARTTYAAAKDWPAIARLARWDAGRGAPVRAILAQSAVALLLVGLGAATRQGFATLVDFTAPVFWLFLSLSGLALIILRSKRGAVERPFRTPFYPVTPLLFIASSLFVLWSSVAYVRVGALAGLGVLAAGLLILPFLSGRQPASPSASET
ncbi:MAG: APC family permease [Alphaproteobacteria bacterium]|nr:APC family permease [Alphaproteobacteria bacterium]